MAMDKQKRLVERLLAKSKQDSVDWRLTIDENRYRVSLSSSGLEIWTVESPNQFEEDIYIAMLNGEGSVVDSFSDVELMSSEGEMPELSWYRQMLELHTLAKRRALGSDAVLDAILNELK